MKTRCLLTGSVEANTKKAVNIGLLLGHLAAVDMNGTLDAAN